LAVLCQFQRSVFCILGVLILIIMEARPTEYLGVVYKSKTEAMFALLLNIVTDEYSSFTYEEIRFKTPDGYIPDFTKYISVGNHTTDFIEMIEIKPSVPNKTYIEYLEKQFQWIEKNDRFNFITFHTLYIFNPYQKIFKSVYYDRETKKMDMDNLDDVGWFNEKYFDELLNYRFDL
jgi:hypothetical protein